MNIGTWNVLSWYRVGAAKHAVEQMEKRNMDITAVQEIRWLNSGNVEISKSQIFYSGSLNGRHEYGTGFVVSNRILNKIINFRPVNERICYMRFNGKFYNLSMIAVHAPTEESDEEEKDTFYEQLDTIISETPKQDMLLLCGDFNAKIGREELYRPTIGLHSLHNISNDNGTRLINQSASSNMIIKSTMFEHKDIHKETWISNDNTTRNQIDHIVVDARHASNILDVRSLRGADGETDHILVRAKIRFRISSQKNTKADTIIKWDINKLQNEEIQKQYQDYVREKIVASPEENEVESRWKNIQTALTEAARNVLGHQKKRSKKNWYDDECKQLVEERQKARKKMLDDPTIESIENHKESRKRARKIFRQKKRRQEREAMAKMENNYNSRNMGQFFREVTSFKNGYRPRLGSILKAPDDTIIADRGRVIEAWKQHFEQMLNVQTEQRGDIQVFSTVDFWVEEPTTHEVKEAIKKLKNNKAPGKDNIPSECLKYGGDFLHQQIHQLIICIWNEEQIPEAWKESIIIPIHKKGDKLKCTNYRGISLIDSAYKVLSNIMLSRLSPLVENILGDYQCGFRKHRSTTDQMFTIRQMLEKCWEFNKQLHNLFIDFRQAYDSVLRVELWNAMAELSIPQKLIRMTKACICDSRSRVRVGDMVSDIFDINNGLRQGDALSPLLFNVALEKATRAAELVVEMYTQRGPQLILAFADDIDIVGTSTIKVKEQFTRLEKESQKMGLKINEEKTKYMHIARQAGRDRVGQNVTMGEFNFERVNSFKYLGAILTSENDTSEEIKARIQSGNRCMYALSNVLRSRDLTRGSKLRIYNTVIRPVVTYGSETWTITKTNERRLRCFERKVLRKIYGPIKDQGTQQYRIRTNKELEELYKSPSIIQEIKSGRLRWAGHVQRQQDNRTIKLAWETNPVGRRPVGRPRMRWRDNIMADLETMNIEANPQIMLDRARWRDVVRSAKTHPGL